MASWSNKHGYDVSVHYGLHLMEKCISIFSEKRDASGV